MLLEIRNYTEATAWRKNVLLNGDLICHSMDKFTNCYKQSKEMVSMSCTPNFKPKLCGLFMSLQYSPTTFYNIFQNKKNLLLASACNNVSY